MSLITKSVYLRGPKGERGLQGLKGERGLTGAQGLPGPAGESDPQFIRNQFSATGNITYNQATGVIGFTNPGYATTTYVDTAISNLVSGAPDLLNTLNELAAAIGNNANFINSVIVKTGGTMTGALILDADPITNLGAATKQYVDQATSSIVTSYNDLTDKPTLFSGSYTDLTSKPTLFSGVYADLTSKPTLFDGVYSSLSGKPSLATVATSGSYNDLTNKPTIPSFDQSLNTTNNVTFNSVTATSIDVENLEFTGTGPIVISSGNDLKFTSAGDITFNGSKLSTVAISGSYTDLTSKPTLFSGSYTDLTDKPALNRLINGSKQVVLESNGYITLANNAQLYDYGNGSGNGYGITDALGSTYIGYDPGDTGGALHMDAYNGKSIRIRTNPYGENNYKDWIFDSAGVLSIPTGGDIKRNGVSVLNSFSGSYTDLTDKPALFSGSYTDLTSKPSLSTVATSGSYTDLTSKPTLFSGSYTDLTDKPTIPSDINQLSDTNGLLGSSGSTVNIQSYNYDATAGQLIFTGQEENQQALSYTDYDFVQVFKNGILLRNNIQYTLNDSGYVDYVAMGDSIELNTPAELNDWIYIIVTSTTTSNPDSITDGGEYADVMEIGLDGGSY